MMRAGRNHNLEYKEGFKREEEAYEQYKGLIVDMLGAEKIEPMMGSLIDKTNCIDAVVLINSVPHGVSLRSRKVYRDFKSFTLSGHITSKTSEVHKWLRIGEGLSPTYHLQISALPDGSLRVVKVHIGTFRYVLNTAHLQDYYNTTLEAYEFPIDDFGFADGVTSQLIKL